MPRPLAAARLLFIAILLAGSPVCAGPGPSLATVRAPAPRLPALAGPHVQAAAPSSGSTSVLNINGSGAIRLHNRFLVGGLILYLAVMTGGLVFLAKRRAAATALLAAGLIVGGLLLARGFG